VLTGSLVKLIPNTDDVEVLITIESGPYRSPGTISDLAGTDPVDTIIEADYPRQHVTAKALRNVLLDQDQQGEVQVYVSFDVNRNGYWAVNRVRTREAGQFVIVADSFLTGTA
jgi:hypothetical protein